MSSGKEPEPVTGRVVTPDAGAVAREAPGETDVGWARQEAAEREAAWDADMGDDEEVLAGRERIALVDLLDRVLAGGVVVAGEVTLSIADVDMVKISLRALVSSVSALAGQSGDRQSGEGQPGHEEPAGW